MKPWHVLVLMLFAPMSSAMFLSPSPVPIDRLLAHLERRVAAAPEDPQSHYQLGRAHYLAMAYRSERVPAYEHGDTPEPAPREHSSEQVYLNQLRWQEAQRRAREQQPDAPEEAIREQAFAIAETLHRQDWRPEPIPPSAVRKHYDAAVRSLDRAVALAPERPLHHLTRASLDDQAEQLAAGGHLAIEVDADPKQFAAQRRESAARHYVRAYLLTRKEDRREKHMPAAGAASLVSHEAGAALVAMHDAGRLPEGLLDDRALLGVRQHVQRMKDKPIRVITPIVLAVDRKRTLDELIDDSAFVRFDLDGDGRAERRPWLTPTAGLLAWDPQQTGRITSGRQLFGNVTWWLFWTDGYAALAVLDDDGDGELRGAELHGLAVWFDRDGDAISDAGEVQPAADLGITALSTRPTATIDGQPMHPRGVELHGQRRLPTWDWIAPAASPVAR